MGDAATVGHTPPVRISTECSPWSFEGPTNASGVHSALYAGEDKTSSLKVPSISKAKNAGDSENSLHRLSAGLRQVGILDQDGPSKKSIL